VAGKPQAARGAERVDVAIPARAEFVSVARLTAAAVAARQGFTYDEVEDLKIAVSEACTSLITAGADVGAPLAVQFALGRNALTVTVEAHGATIALAPAARGNDEPLDEGRMGMFLMQCLVDEVEILRNDEAETTAVRLVKRHEA